MDTKGKETRDQIAKLLNIDSDLSDEDFCKKVEEESKQIRNKAALEKVLLLLDKYLKSVK